MEKRKNFKIKNGSNRVTFLIGNYAIKIPKIVFHKPIISFCIGYLSNVSEVEKWKECSKESLASFDEHTKYWIEERKKLCPIENNFLGFFLIMKRADELTENEFNYIKKQYQNLWDCKKENFGNLNNSIVLTDYADDFRGYHYQLPIFK